MEKRYCDVCKEETPGTYVRLVANRVEQFLVNEQRRLDLCWKCWEGIAIHIPGQPATEGFGGYIPGVPSPTPR